MRRARLCGAAAAVVILGLTLGAILATIRYGPPDAPASHPVAATGAVSGQIERLIEPQARADLFSGVILVLFSAKNPACV